MGWAASGGRCVACVEPSPCTASGLHTLAGRSQVEPKANQHQHSQAAGAESPSAHALEQLEVQRGHQRARDGVGRHVAGAEGAHGGVLKVALRALVVDLDEGC